MNKYCSECGAKLEGLGNFCAQCGTAIKQTVKKERAISEPPMAPQPTATMIETNKNNFYKKKLIFWSVNAALVVLLNLCFYFLADNFYNEPQWYENIFTGFSVAATLLAIPAAITYRLLFGKLSFFANKFFFGLILAANIAIYFLLDWLANQVLGFGDKNPINFHLVFFISILMTISVTYFMFDIKKFKEDHKSGFFLTLGLYLLCLLIFLLLYL